MTTTQRIDPLPGFAARFYGVHRAILQLGNKSPSHLHEEFSMLGSKVESFGGKIVTGVDAMGQKGPVVLDKNEQALNYDLGHAISEQIVNNVLADLARQA